MSNNVYPLHLVTLQVIITHARDFELVELEANYAHAINLVMNRSSELDFKLKQFIVHQPILSFFNQLSGSHSRNLEIGYVQNPNSQHYLSLLITPENASSNKPEPNQQPILTNNIPPTTSTEDKTLTAIFLFELKKMTSVLLFSRAALNTKPITMMYTNAKVDGHSIKLILDSGSAGSIITRQFIDQLSR
ncbi:hypothetical protein G9A89_005763 [Geosiphon pyriformis]|nr:hypothetical protein G9A89_005763 [Geosiphon pyriformis]